MLLYGFRPFFLAAGIWAPVALILWIGVLQGGLVLPITADPVTWHAHELLFGYLAAAVAGFLLTAIPNWTGKLPLRGRPLAILALLWLAGRIAISVSAVLGVKLTAVVDLSFPAILLALVLREIVTGRNWRNLPMVAALFLIFAANLLTHFDALTGGPWSQTGLRLGIATIAALVALVGGRIIPSFTLNWLKKHGEKSLPAPFGTVDRLAIILLLATLAAWTVRPESLFVAVLAAAAALTHLLRLSRWRGHRVLREPLLWVLHLGYLWLPVGLGLMSLGAFNLAPPIASIHALTTGTMATMTLAVMTRATLGHTGRELTAGPGTTAVFILITIAASGRTAAGILPDLYGTLLNGAALAWLLAFSLFLFIHAPMLLRPGRGVST